MLLFIDFSPSYPLTGESESRKPALHISEPSLQGKHRVPGGGPGDQVSLRSHPPGKYEGLPGPFSLERRECNAVLV